MQDNEFEAWGGEGGVDESPGSGLGLDYVSFVIEWDPEDEELLHRLREGGVAVDEMVMSPEPPEIETAHGPLRKIAIALGALGALFAAGWGFRKLREA